MRVKDGQNKTNNITEKEWVEENILCSLVFTLFYIVHIYVYGYTF